MNIKENIKHIAKQAEIRKEIVISRLGKKDQYNNYELVAKTNEEVELYDAIDSLNDEETTQLVNIAKEGGLIIGDGFNRQEVTDSLFLEINLGHYLHEGLIVAQT